MHIESLVSETARETGLMIYEMAVMPSKGVTRVVIKIDALRPISHEDCEKFSRALSEKLDLLKKDFDYSLEVSSPGLNRKVRSMDEFIRFIGAPAKVIYERGGKRECFKGSITLAQADRVILEDEKKKLELVFGDIVQAHLDY